ncbi:MAG TPA: GNAT family N-acyltransferase, partial [Candidatus Binataceae bacterium]|nr:GNAT family N-acyltransferase [Candidatus Binataceae bacterium]
VDAGTREAITAIGRAGRTRRFSCALARNEGEVIEAMRLRWRIFADEMNGAHLPHNGGLEGDRFDPFCDHLLVRDTHSGLVVGTYRILGDHGARAAGGYYSETEFRLEGLRNLGGRVMEVGRACVDPCYRNGAVISTLWAGLFKYILTGKYDYVIGCGSISLKSGARPAAAICRRIAREHPCPADLRAVPLCRFPVDEFAGSNQEPEIDTDAALPPLIKGYLRLGAWICGDPAWDPLFNTADLLIVLPVAGLDRRYFSRYLREL